MGVVLSFALGCLVTAGWRASPRGQRSVKAAQQVSSDTPYATKAKEVVKTAGQRVTEIRAARVSRKPVIDDELKDILFEYAIDQIKQGKIKVIEDID